MDNKGMAQQLIMVLLLLGVLTGIILIWFVFSLVAPVATGLIDETTQIVTQTASTDGNLSQINQATLVPINQGLQNLKWIGYSILIFMVLGLLVSAFFVRTYPFLIVVWILFVIVLVFASLFMANAYKDLSSGDDVISGYYKSWETNDFILNYLPHLVSVIGFLGGFILFVLVSRDSESEVLL